VTVARPRKASILLVDDTPANLVALEAILEPLGENLVSAHSGREALRLLLRDEFALILMDVRMADMDGIETARLIRERARTADVPIIFVTAFDRAESDMSAAYEVGAADFIFKPFRPDALRAKVATFVDLFHKTEAVRAQAEQLRVLEQREHQRRLREVERERAAAEARFANIVELAPDGILAFDDRGRILLFNRGAERLFGVRSPSAPRLTVEDLFPGGLPSAAAAPVEVTGRRADGAEFPAEVSVSQLEIGGGVVTTAICRDITERRRAEDAVRALNDELNTRLRTGIDLVADLAGSLNPGEVMERLLSRLAETVGAQQGVLLGVDGDGLTVLNSHDADGRRRLQRGRRFPAFRILKRALDTRRPVLNGTFTLDAVDRSVATWLDGVRYTVALPLRVGDDDRALILLARRAGERFDEQDLEALGMIGNVAAVALRNAQLFAQAEAASVSKSEFLNMAAHELRTPLSVITGYLSMLEDGTLGPPGDAWGRPIDILNVKAGELNKLVDALLLAARMEAGTIHGEPEPVDVVAAVREALHRAEPRAHMLGAELQLESPSEPVIAQVDPSHLGRIVDNLINNALTYSTGTPWVKVTVGPDGQVGVEDRGLGVPEERREAIFERFYRVNDPSLPPQPGTGLGLYLSRELARRNGGELVLTRSVAGEGSLFQLSLVPAPVVSPAAAAALEGRSA
jgi:PAS domain S-box-containing protein